MKVVLFCGGQGTRLREYTDVIPKPLVPVGERPILWHVMKYYASFGHTEFILCLGYKGEAIKRFFLEYNEALSNDFVLEGGGKTVRLLNRDIEDWCITFVDTGQSTNIGGRLLKVREHLGDDEMFLANYSDTLTDANVNVVIDELKAKPESVASFLCVKPPYSFHLVHLNPQREVTDITDVRESDVWINGGYFVLRRQIFDVLQPGDELVVEAFDRLTKAGSLCAHMHHGFWACMDTFKEKQKLDELLDRGDPPWQVSADNDPHDRTAG